MRPPVNQKAPDGSDDASEVELTDDDLFGLKQCPIDKCRRSRTLIFGHSLLLTLIPLCFVLIICNAHSTFSGNMAQHANSHGHDHGHTHSHEDVECVTHSPEEETAVPFTDSTSQLRRDVQTTLGPSDGEADPRLPRCERGVDWHRTEQRAKGAGLRLRAWDNFARTPTLLSALGVMCVD